MISNLSDPVLMFLAGIHENKDRDHTTSSSDISYLTRDDVALYAGAKHLFEKVQEGEHKGRPSLG